MECEFEFAVAGDSVVERRFVECKHHMRGVPPQELEAALSAATAERPDALLFMVSGFLSNPAKERLRAYQANNRPPFRILVWEHPDLLTRVGRYGTLLRKYGLSDPEPHLALLHPAHVRYLREVPDYTLDELFAVLEALRPDERTEHLDWVRHSVIRPRMRAPRHKEEVLADLIVDPTDYQAFKAACRRIDIDEMLLVGAVVDTSLRALLRASDTSSIGVMRQRQQDFIDFMRRRLPVDRAEQDALQRLIAKHETMLAEIESRVYRNRGRYDAFCERVLLPLLKRTQRLPEPPSE